MSGDRLSAIGGRHLALGSRLNRQSAANCRPTDFRVSDFEFRISQRKRPSGRAGFSLLELQVAFVVFGIALTGLCPLVVMQTRHVKNLEARLNPQTVYYFVPSSDLWTAKLGAAATVTSQYVTPTPPPTPPTPVNQVQILSLDKSLTSEIVTAHVSVSP
jgi:type II secretory pathway pseudopilin PulG